MKQLIFSCILFSSLILFISCKDEYNFSTDNMAGQEEINTELAVPLIDASFSLDDYVSKDSDSYFQVDNDGFMTLVFDYLLKEVTAPEFFSGIYGGTLADITYDIPEQYFNLGSDRAVSNNEFYVSDPLVSITIANFWDIPVQMQLVDFKYYNDANPSGLPVTGSFVSSWHDIERPVAPDIYTYTTLYMDNSNSNLDEVISAMPTKLSSAAVLQTTPGSAYTVDPLSTDTVRLKIELPLDLRISNLIMNDTLDFKSGKDLVSDTASVDSLFMNLVFENGFPIDIEALVILTDSNYNHLDTIQNPLENGRIIIPSGVVSAGKVISSTKYTILGYEADKNAIVNARYIISSFTFNTYNNQLGETVKIYSGYQIGLKVGARVKFKI